MKNLKVVMAKVDMEVNTLAKETGLSKQTISSYRTGKGNPSLKTIKKIAKALGVEEKELF